MVNKLVPDFPQHLLQKETKKQSKPIKIALLLPDNLSIYETPFHYLNEGILFSDYNLLLKRPPK